MCCVCGVFVCGVCGVCVYVCVCVINRSVRVTGVLISLQNRTLELKLCR